MRASGTARRGSTGRGTPGARPFAPARTPAGTGRPQRRPRPCRAPGSTRKCRSPAAIDSGSGSTTTPAPARLTSSRERHPAPEHAREPRGQGLHGSESEVLGEGWQDEHIRGSEEVLLHLAADLPEPVDLIADPFASREVAETPDVIALTSAPDEQGGGEALATEDGQGPEQALEILHRIDPRESENPRAGRRDPQLGEDAIALPHLNALDPERDDDPVHLDAQEASLLLLRRTREVHRSGTPQCGTLQAGQGQALQPGPSTGDSVGGEGSERPEDVGHAEMPGHHGRRGAGEGEESMDVDDVEPANVAPEPRPHARSDLVELRPLSKVDPLDPRGRHRDVFAEQPLIPGPASSVVTVVTEHPRAASAFSIDRIARLGPP